MHLPVFWGVNEKKRIFQTKKINKSGVPARFLLVSASHNVSMSHLPFFWQVFQ